MGNRRFQLHHAHKNKEKEQDEKKRTTTKSASLLVRVVRPAPAAADTHQRMIPTKRHRQPPFHCMRLDALRHPSCHRANQSRFLHVSNRRVWRRCAIPRVAHRVKGDILELRMTIKLDFPAETAKLVEQTRGDERVWAQVDAGSALTTGEGAADDLRQR